MRGDPLRNFAKVRSSRFQFTSLKQGGRAGPVWRADDGDQMSLNGYIFRIHYTVVEDENSGTIAKLQNPQNAP